VIEATKSCIRIEHEKQIIFRTKRLIRARNMVCLRSIFWVCCFPYGVLGRIKMAAIHAPPVWIKAHNAKWLS
jgi:hypothetical protein